jgi:hypothetical protein
MLVGTHDSGIWDLGALRSTASAMFGQPLAFVELSAGGSFRPTTLPSAGAELEAVAAMAMSRRG